MAKGTTRYKSRGGVSVDAYVVTEQEKTLDVPIEGGTEHLRTGDALVTVAGRQHIVRAPVWDLLFGGTEQDDDSSTARGGAAAKGGQQSSKTQG